MAEDNSDKAMYTQPNRPRTLLPTEGIAVAIFRRSMRGRITIMSYLSLQSAMGNIHLNTLLDETKFVR